MTTDAPDPLAPSPASSPEQRAACLTQHEEAALLAGGWREEHGLWVGPAVDGTDGTFDSASAFGLRRLRDEAAKLMGAPPERAPTELTAERLDELDQLAREAAERASGATPGRWKLWGTDVYADQDGTSNIDTAVRVADTFFTNERSQFRTNDATFIAAAREDVPALSAAVLALSAEVRRLRKRDVAWQRATRVGDPADVGERNVRLCSCDGADLPQIGDEIDACETCDGMVKAQEDGEQ